MSSTSKAGGSTTTASSTSSSSSVSGKSSKASTTQATRSTSTSSPSSGNSTVTCLGPAPGNDILLQIVTYVCWFKDLLFGFLKTLPLDFNLALGLFIGACVLVLLLLCCCCFCICRKCCGKKKEKKKKRVKEKKEYEYLDPKEAPAFKSTKNPKTAFDSIPLVGTTIQEMVQPNLYRIPENAILESGLLSADGDESVEAKVNFGRLQFSMRTSGKKSPDLIVNIIQAIELNPMGQCNSGVPDPYITVALLPKNIVYETKVMKQNHDPMFQEEFTFHSVSKLATRQLKFQAWHFDRINVKNPPIGEILIDLAKYDLDKPVEEWHRFKEVNEKALGSNRFEFGLLCLSIQYTPVVSRLTICILEAAELPPDPTSKGGGRKKLDDDDDDDQGESEIFDEESVKIDPMVKATLKLDGKKVKKENTSTKRNTMNPYYNEMINFEVSPEHIRNVQLTLSVVHTSAIGLPITVGRIHFGPHAAGRARQHWLDCLETQGRPVAQWHVLANPKQKIKKKD